MKRFMIAAGLVLLAGIASAETAAPKTDSEKLSYSMGVATAVQMKRQSIEVDAAMFALGFRNTFEGGSLLLTEQEIQDALVKFQEDMTVKQVEKMRKASEQNRKEGEAFLADNKTKEGVITLPSGLQYKILKEGTGRMPKEGDSVTTHYRGLLINGTEFDSSIKRGEPATFPVKGVIKGWTEALQLMKEGSKWMLYLPSDLAYGDRGTGSLIGPGATLIFEVELLSIESAGAQGETKK